MKLVTIVGARPQFIKAAPVSRALRGRHREVLVHTGQHYDEQMSSVFFQELEIPEPDYQLGIGSGRHGAQTGAMLARIEEVLLAERPDRVVVYGDTNSTLAGALAAAKLGVPLAHVEAGLRSFVRTMPEEINRVVADRLSDRLLCPSRTAVENLAAEGITRGVCEVGDVMVDALALAAQRARSRTDVLARLGLVEKRYLLVTVHRAQNTDEPERLDAIVSALCEAGEPVVFPLHPRTRQALGEEGRARLVESGVTLAEPAGYLDMVRLTEAARLVLTDSGGLQKEAYWLGTPCVTLRDETEWVETVAAGWNRLAGADTERIREAIHSFAPPSARPQLYGSPGAAERVVAALEG
jgi:UDP-GlcNAc3NAcA epimerase